MKVIEVPKEQSDELAKLRASLERAKRLFGAKADSVRTLLEAPKGQFSDDYRYLVVQEEKH